MKRALLLTWNVMIVLISAPSAVLWAYHGSLGWALANLAAFASCAYELTRAAHGKPTRAWWQ